MSMLKVQGLKKAFGIDELFSDVNFEISRGDKVGFVGPNGAGKTTLMRCLMGLEESDGGTVAFDTNATIGYVEQQADFGDGTLFEEFKRAFEDIIELGERKKALEKAIAENVYPDLCDTKEIQKTTLDGIASGETGQKAGKGLFDWSVKDEDDFRLRKQAPYFEGVKEWNMPE